MSNNIDCGDCPNITDGCRDLCEKIDLGVSRWSANWHMQEYYQSKHGDYVSAADFAAAQSQLAALREDLAKSEALSVTSILMDVVPGHDGMGLEVYAKSVADVQLLISNLHLKTEDQEQSLADAKEELETVKRQSSFWHENSNKAIDAMAAVADQRDNLQQRLADAERRNAECMALLAETSKSILRHQAEQPMSNRLAGLLTKARAKVDRYLKAALNPKPEAASHDE